MPLSLPAVVEGPASFGSSKEFEDLIYLLSHDVRNSVRALIELPQWIEQDLAAAGIKVGGSLEQTIGLMNCHTARLDRMLFDLLTFSRVGRMQDVLVVDLDDALTDVMDEIGLPEGWIVIRNMDSPTLRIGEMDAPLLLRALISNAIKHHDRDVGKIVVTTHTDRTETVLSVRDDGPGISNEFREQVFEAMRTLQPRDEVEGSGMGLTIARKIAQHYGGSVAITSPGSKRGLEVEVRFPAIQ